MSEERCEALAEEIKTLEYSAKQAVTVVSL